MGYVYLIYDANNDVYKIGVTRSKDSKRIKQLQTGNSCELRVLYMHNTPYPFRLETMLHNYYINSLVHGEWYKDVGIDDFKERCKEFDSHIIALKDNPFFNKGLK